MAEGTIRNYIIAVIIFVFFITGTVSLMGILGEHKPSYADDRYSEFNDTFNVYQQINESVGNIQNDIQNTTTGDNFLDSLIGGSYTTLRLMFTSLGFMRIVFGGVATFFGVPVWIPTILFMIVTVVIAFAIFRAIFQREP